MTNCIKRLPTEWEDSSASFSSHTGLVANAYKELKKLNIQKMNSSNQKTGCGTDQTVPKEEIKLTTNAFRKCLTPTAIRKHTLNYFKVPSYPARMATIKKTTANADEDVGRRSHCPMMVEVYIGPAIEL